MDLAKSRPDTAPDVEAHHLEIESRNSLGGFRGVVELGTIGAGATIANAIADALAPFGVEPAELPHTLDRIFQLCSRAGSHSSTG
jgi:aerobic carbon-monoxide dehydrogenase large subunit